MLYKSDNAWSWIYLYFVHFYFLFCSISTLKVFLTIVDVAIFQSDSYNIERILLSWIFISNNNFSYANSFKKNIESEVFNMVQHGLLGRLLFCLSCQEVHPFKRTLPRQQNMNVRWFNLPQNGMMSQGWKQRRQQFMFSASWC